MPAIARRRWRCSAELDQPDIPRRGPNAMFSLLAPGAHIPPHTGVANTRLVCHLPLIVPPGCWFRVGAETRDWEVGKAWVFDDTIEHEALNPSDALRVIFIVDTWHPGPVAGGARRGRGGDGGDRPGRADGGAVTARGGAAAEGRQSRRCRCGVRGRGEGGEERARSRGAAAARAAARAPSRRRAHVAGARPRPSRARGSGAGGRRVRESGGAGAERRAHRPQPRPLQRWRRGCQSVDLFERALALAPNDGAVLLGRAAAQLAEGRIDDAIAGLDGQLARHPGWIPGHATLAGCAGCAASARPSPQLRGRARRGAARGRDVARTGRTPDPRRPYTTRSGGDRRAAARRRGRTSPSTPSRRSLSPKRARSTRPTALFAALGPIAHVTIARYLRHLLRAGRPGGGGGVRRAAGSADPAR